MRIQWPGQSVLAGLCWWCQVKSKPSLPAGRAAAGCLFLVSRFFAVYIWWLVDEIVLILLPPVLKCFTKVKRSTMVVEAAAWAQGAPGDALSEKAGSFSKSRRESLQCWAVPALVPRLAHAANSLLGERKMVLCTTERSSRGKSWEMLAPGPCREAKRLLGISITLGVCSVITKAPRQQWDARTRGFNCPLDREIAQEDAPH